MATSRPSVSSQVTIDDIGNRARKALRKIDLIRKYSHQGELYTFDVPFRMILSKNKKNLAILIDKKNLPNKYPLENFSKSKEYLESAIGLPMNIMETQENIILLCMLQTDKQ